MTKENDFIGMQMCPYCNEAMGILIDRNLKSIPKMACTGPEPCDKCKEKHKNDSVVPMWEAERTYKGLDFTGRYIFFKRAAVIGKEFINMMNTVGFLVCDKETMQGFTKKMNEK